MTRNRKLEYPLNRSQPIPFAQEMEELIRVSRDRDERLDRDRSLLRWFAIILVLILIFDITMGFLFTLSGSLIFDLLLAFLIIGLISLVINRGSVKISIKRVMIYFLIASLVLGIAISVALFTLDITGFVELQFDNGGGIGAFIAVFLVAFIVGIFAQLFSFVVGFGAIGVVVALERRLTTGILMGIAGLSKKEKKGLRDKILSWVFNVPRYLDSTTLTVSTSTSEGFPWRRFWKATGWEVIFASILALYISLNPFLLSTMRIEQLFSTLSSASFLLPLIILPWFIYAAINARIEGVTNDFKLYDGIKSKVFQTLGLIGTLLVFIRFALERSSAETIGALFASFLIIFIIVATIFNFIYFNSFEEGLAHDVCDSYDAMRKSE